MSAQLLATASTHRASLVSRVDDLWNFISELVIRTSWSPLSKVAEAGVTSMLARIAIGQLRIVTPSQTYIFPQVAQKHSTSTPSAELRVVSDTFWMRLATMSDLGFAEAYMYGDVECEDLISVFKLFIRNKAAISGLNSRLSQLYTLPQKITSFRFMNTITNSRSNISAHYDLSNQMFAAFLSEDMTYSCGIFSTLDADINGESSSTERQPRTNGNAQPERDELHDAQIRKLMHIIRKADIRQGHRVLEIGTGWGSFAILAVQMTGCEVDTITLSVQQQALAQQRIKLAGLSDKIRVHLLDYRNLPPEWEHAFDRLVSIEMVEAVGKEFMETYWSVIDWALKEQGGVGVIQGITIPESRFENYAKDIDFIRKWIFPGGFLPTVTFLLQTMEASSSGRLIVDSIANIGPHYARTLREWRYRFESKFDTDITDSLVQEYPDVMGQGAGAKASDEIEVFRRKWLYYFYYCEVGFSERLLGTHIITFAREGATEYRFSISA